MTSVGIDAEIDVKSRRSMTPFSMMMKNAVDACKNVAIRSLQGKRPAMLAVFFSLITSSGLSFTG